ncbi:hypothetical protein BegalDRAFT_2137 [Beggiatoa alba B18LD]|uniref:Uncharacterized protein n=1 Tax=Beggiatoa alba B18LD TaxID=395493 RepID=I3CHA8_9GAMM|nr:hypothetical protein [Beggiatoa alba]EIJ43001.1 hypothetical protein BegalDRAFT_2137 [Beggiatoa alba B18LD]
MLNYTYYYILGFCLLLCLGCTNNVLLPNPRLSVQPATDEATLNWFTQIQLRNQAYEQARLAEQHADQQWLNEHTQGQKPPAVTQQPANPEENSLWGAMQAKQRYLSLHQQPIETPETPTLLYEQWNNARQTRQEADKIRREAEMEARETWEKQLKAWDDADRAKREQYRIDRLREKYGRW